MVRGAIAPSNAPYFRSNDGGTAETTRAARVGTVSVTRDFALAEAIVEIGADPKYRAAISPLMKNGWRGFLSRWGG
jgi:hypothetical protein